MDIQKIKAMFQTKNLKFIIILIVVGLVIIFLPDFSGSENTDVDIKLSGSSENLEYAKAHHGRWYDELMEEEKKSQKAG